MKLSTVLLLPLLGGMTAGVLWSISAVAGAVVLAAVITAAGILSWRRQP